MDKSDLIEGGQEFARILGYVAVKDTDALFDRLVEIQKDRLKDISFFKRSNEYRKIKEHRKKFQAIFFHEMLWFCFHLTDRLAFEYLPIEERDIFIDNLNIGMCERLSEMYNSTIAQRWPSLCNARQAEYSKYSTLMPEKEEGGYGGTLFWEFAKKICTTLEFYEHDVVIIMTIFGYCTGAMGKLTAAFGGFLEPEC